MVYCLVDKALILSNEQFHHKNLTIAKNILKNNNYPLDFINKLISNRREYLKDTNF